MQTTFTKKYLHNPEPILLWLEWALLFAALAMYIYFIALSVSQVVLRQELAVSIQEAETRVSQLEATYFERSNEISRDTADEFGLVAVTSTSYINVDASSERLTRND